MTDDSDNALDLADVNPDRSLCLAAWQAGRPWYAPTREDWLAALVCEQFVLRPRVRKEAR